MEAATVRFALEVFEDEGIVKEARERIDKETSPEYQRGRDYRNLQAARDGLQPTKGHRVSGKEFAHSGFSQYDPLNLAGHSTILVFFNGVFIKYWFFSREFCIISKTPSLVLLQRSDPFLPTNGYIYPQ